MKPLAISVLAAGMMLCASQVPAQAPKAGAEVKAAVDEIILQARKADKAQEELVARLTEGKATRDFYMERVNTTDQSVKAIRRLIDKLDENYDALNDDQQDAVREAWDIAMLLGAFVDNLKDAAEKLGSKQDQEEARVNAQCAARRAKMMVETLNRLTAAAPAPPAPPNPGRQGRPGRNQ